MLNSISGIVGWEISPRIGNVELSTLLKTEKTIDLAFMLSLSHPFSMPFFLPPFRLQEIEPCFIFAPALVVVVSVKSSSKYLK